MAAPKEPDANAKAPDADRPTIRGWASQLVTRLLSPQLRARVIEVSITAPSEVARDQAMEFSVTLRNRLPVPVELETGVRPWYWYVDGVHDADRAEPDPEGRLLEESGTLGLEPLETKEITRMWNGRVRRDEDGPFLPLEPGDYELGVEVTAVNASRPQAIHRFRVV